MKRYRDYNTYLRDIFGERVQKIPLDAGMNCPNRDGTTSDKGCIYCDSRGSGTGAMINRGLTIDEQIRESRKRLKKRYGAKKFIAYFQSFTNTYAPVSQLKELYDRALNYPDMVGLSVGTRPDCVNKEILGLLDSYQEKYLVWIEYGLQSMHDKTLSVINRGHKLEEFLKAVELTREYKNIKVCVHVIIGLPNETEEDIIETAKLLGESKVEGIKIHPLHVVKGTLLANQWRKGEYTPLSFDDYIKIAADLVEMTPKYIIFHRLTGTASENILLAPAWCSQKWKVLNAIENELKKRGTCQGAVLERKVYGGCEQ